MPTLRFYGASDDLFEIEGGGLDDEIGCYDRGAAVRLEGSGGQMVVYAHYAPEPTPGACWVIGVTMVEEDHPLPLWPMRFETHQRGYSSCLVIDAPDDVKMTNLGQEDT